LIVEKSHFKESRHVLKFLANLAKFTVKFLRNKEEGATAVEYGLLVAAIAAVIVGTVVSIGGKIKTAFVTVDTQLDAATSGGS